MPRIDEYLGEILDRKGSDLHFLAGDPPRIRLYGDLSPLRNERRIGKLGKMKAQRRGRKAERIGKRARRHALRPGLDKQPEHGQPMLLRQRRHGANRLR